MGTTVTLKAGDGHRFSAYRADPTGAPRGGLLVVQEIFGVNAHIRGVCDGYADAGYVALAPALFDRVERDLELGYDPEDSKRGFETVVKLRPEAVLRDLQAGVGELRKAGKVGVVGYCYGGTMAFVAACRLEGLAAASCYYGAHIARQHDMTPKVPTLLHFGEHDAMIPMSDVDAIRAAHPSATVYVYPAHHGFNCDARASYHAQSAQLARERTLALFHEHIG